MTKHPRMIAAIALITLTATTLTGCLVNKKEPEPPYSRKTDNLRVYKQGDWIRYNVIATSLSGTSAGNVQAGTLEIRWGNYSTLLSPDGDSYDVIEKSYLYCLDGAFCDPTETIVIQYVQQDDPLIDPTTTTAGTERLVAMGSHPTTGQYYWLNTVGGSSFTPGGVTGGQETVTTLKSPLSIGQSYPVVYDLMDDCISGNASCGSDIGRFANSIEVIGDGTQLNTNINNYANPLEINFNGNITPDVSPLPLKFDIFDICSNEISTHSGKMFIIPEVGVIQLTNTCTDSGTGDIILYDITIDTISSSIASGS